MKAGLFFIWGCLLLISACNSSQEKGRSSSAATGSAADTTAIRSCCKPASRSGAITRSIRLEKDTVR